MYKLVAFDIDGTILPNGHKELSPEVLKMFEKLKKAGYIVAYATGRETITIDKMIDTPNVDYFLGANGTFIYDMKKKETLWETNVKYEDYKPLEEFCELHNINLSVITQHSVYFKNKDQYKENWFWGQFYDLIKPLNDPSMKDENIQQITIRTSNSDEKDMVHEFVKNVDNLTINTIWDTGMFLGAKGVNKATGLERLGKMLNIKLSEMIAFGDGQNDHEMLKEVGMGIAMEKSSDKLKALANDICEKVEDFGTIKKLEEMNII